MNRIGVIGAGVMGSGLAVDLSTSGYEVILVDTEQAILNRAKEDVEKGIKFAGLYKKDIDGETEEINKRVNYTLDISDVATCEFIIENVTEDYEIKKDIYSKLDKICEPEVCFAVNTSCISIDKIASLVSRKDKIIGMHFMNPVILKKSIEEVRGYHTSEETIETAGRLLTSLGKKGILIRDAVGFASNRVSHLFMNEAMYVVMDQTCEPKDVDQIFRECFAHTMGPLETADLIGLDTVMNSLDVLFESYHDMKYRCCPLLRQMVSQGRLGRKSGEGFYKYNNEKQIRKG